MHSLLTDLHSDTYHACNVCFQSLSSCATQSCAYLTACGPFNQSGDCTQQQSTLHSLCACYNQPLTTACYALESACCCCGVTHLVTAYITLSAMSAAVSGSMPLYTSSARCSSPLKRTMLNSVFTAPAANPNQNHATSDT